MADQWKFESVSAERVVKYGSREVVIGVKGNWGGGGGVTAANLEAHLEATKPFALELWQVKVLATAPGT